MGDDGEVASKRGKQQSVRDMVLSMAVIGLIVAGIYVFIPHSGTDPVKTVSYRVELGQVRRTAPYPVAAPEGLPKGWRATSVSYDGSNPRSDHWHLGFIDPQEQYAAIDQTNAAAAEFIADVTHDSHHTGAQTVAGATWQRYDGGRYRALARTDHGATTVVYGTAPYSQLAQLVGALHTS
jgi:hypothetical protein